MDGCSEVQLKPTRQIVSTRHSCRSTHQYALNGSSNKRISMQSGPNSQKLAHGSAITTSKRQVLRRHPVRTFRIRRWRILVRPLLAKSSQCRRPLPNSCNFLLAIPAMLAGIFFTQLTPLQVIRSARDTHKIGQHVMVGPVGTVAGSAGPITCATDSLQIRLFGRGAHGSMPQVSIDPVVLRLHRVPRGCRKRRRRGHGRRVADRHQGERHPRRCHYQHRHQYQSRHRTCIGRPHHSRFWNHRAILARCR